MAMSRHPDLSPRSVRRSTLARSRSIPLVAAATAIAAAIVLSVGSAAPARADLVCKPAGHPRATILMFHAGGFISGSGQDMTNECHAFARNGYLTVGVDYSRRYFPAVNDASARVRSYRHGADTAHRPLFAYGLSAGAAFAALLAERGEVDAAFTGSGVYDVAAWARPNPKLMKIMGVTAASLAGKTPVDVPLSHPAPRMILHNRHDAVAPFGPALRVARRSKRFGLHTLEQPTNGYAAHILQPTGVALAYFNRQIAKMPSR
jgi:hypothetical protein